MIRKLATLPIRMYQLVISPLMRPRCKYVPSCSEYARMAINEFGVLKGLVLAGWRLLRCNPASHGGIDYPCDQKLFRR
jgi:putative membrane protein insertion efficiency factor